MTDEQNLEPKPLEQSEQDRIQQVKEQIKNSKYFINRTQSGKGIAIIGGERHRKDAE